MAKPAEPIELVCTRTVEPAARRLPCWTRRPFPTAIASTPASPSAKVRSARSYACWAFRPAICCASWDPAYAELGLSGKTLDDELICAMARHPTLVQRPIGRLRGKAVVGRPRERLLELVGG